MKWLLHRWIANGWRLEASSLPAASKRCPPLRRPYQTIAVKAPDPTDNKAASLSENERVIATNLPTAEASPPSGMNTTKKARSDEDAVLRQGRDAWKSHKAAMKKKFGDEGWNPRKKLSPDTLEGIRTMHSSDPTRFTTAVLAEHFEVSPEAIRRILKSKWQPSAEEAESRRERWEKRGERIWTDLAEMGLKPPKPWRMMGVGKAEPGAIPVWRAKRPSGQVLLAKRSANKRKAAENMAARRDMVAMRPEPAPSERANAGNSISNRML